jgi:hypothetical protein
VVACFFLDFIRESPLYFQLLFMLASNTFSVVAVWVLMFIDREYGSETWKKWAPALYATLVVVTWLVIPVANIIVEIIVICEPKLPNFTDPVESFVVF